MVKPLFVLAQFAAEPCKKLPRVMDELPVKVLDAPLSLILVLENRRNLSRLQLRGQTVHRKPVNHLQRADPRKRPAEKLNNPLDR